MFLQRGFEFYDGRWLPINRLLNGEWVRVFGVVGLGHPYYPKNTRRQQVFGRYTEADLIH